MRGPQAARAAHIEENPSKKTQEHRKLGQGARYARHQIAGYVRRKVRIIKR